jgi:hypothetical protein
VSVFIVDVRTGCHSRNVAPVFIANVRADTPKILPHCLFY